MAIGSLLGRKCLPRRRRRKEEEKKKEKNGFFSSSFFLSFFFDFFLFFFSMSPSSFLFSSLRTRLLRPILTMKRSLEAPSPSQSYSKLLKVSSSLFDNHLFLNFFSFTTSFLLFFLSLSQLDDSSIKSQSPSYRRDRAVGIEEYVSTSAPGLFGVLKERFSDFQVHEVDLGGKITRLTDLKYAEEKPPEPEHNEILAARGFLFFFFLFRRLTCSPLLRCADSDAAAG